jgi:SAM-dependent methyltransferase
MTDRREGGRAVRAVVRREFERAAESFAERTTGRFDNLNVVAFSGIEPGSTVLEVGAGTGNFLALFAGVAGRRIAVDLTPHMLQVARRRHAGLELVSADGAHLPFASETIEFVCSAQALHHIPRPVPVVMEMRRVLTEEGRLLIVDQAASERFEEARAMTELDLIRDPSHAASRPPSALRTVLRAAGLKILAERLVESEGRLSGWMWPEEFPAERIAAVRAFIEERGHTTGMNWRREGDDWVFLRRRLMLLAAKA